MPALRVLRAGELLSAYLNRQAGDFLRALRRKGAEESAASGAGDGPHRTLIRTARRISGALETFRPLVDSAWADGLGEELDWLAETLVHEHRYAARLDRLLTALDRLCGGLLGDAQTRAVGASRAAALLERQLTRARTRGHSATLQALGSSRFHALADAVALLASEVPLSPSALDPADRTLLPLAEDAHRRFTDAVDTLALGQAATAYNGDALLAALFPHQADTAAPAAAGAGRGPEPAGGPEDADAPWENVLALARLSRYAFEVCGDPEEPLALHLGGISSVLVRHEDAAAAAKAAATAARTPRIAPATAYALGVLHADQRRDVEAARYMFSRMWHRAGGVPRRPAPHEARPDDGAPETAGRPVDDEAPEDHLRPSAKSAVPLDHPPPP